MTSSRYQVPVVDLTTHIVEDRRAEVSPWGRGNSKIGPSVFTYSKRPAVTCPGASEECLAICIGPKTRVLLADGTQKPISLIVNRRERLALPCFDDHGRMVIGEITGWHKNSLADRKMYRVSYKRCGAHGHGTAHALLTEDHQVLTLGGWVRADCLRDGQRIATAEVAPNGRQREIITGSLLGDGNLANMRSTCKARLNLRHAPEQVEWLSLKLSSLASLGACTPQTTIKAVQGYTSSLAYLGELRDSVYINGRRCYSRDFINGITLLSLVVWFLDDGSCAQPSDFYNNGTGPRKRGGYGGTGGTPTLSVACKSKSKYEQDALAARIEELGYGVTPGRGLRLTFTSDGARKFAADAAPYVPPSMRYKLKGLIDQSVPFTRSLWNTGEAETYFGSAIVSQCESASKNVYCLSISPHESFVAGGVVVHNCYALRAERQNEWVAKLWDLNTKRGDTLPDLPEGAKLVRAHVAGDFDTVKYVRTWLCVANSNPAVTFWAYTRSWAIAELEKELHMLGLLPNVFLWASIDLSMQALPPAHWRRAWIEGDERLIKDGRHYRTFDGRRAIICPEATGRLPNCETCRFCFLPHSTDLVFPRH